MLRLFKIPPLLGPLTRVDIVRSKKIPEKKRISNSVPAKPPFRWTPPSKKGAREQSSRVSSGAVGDSPVTYRLLFQMGQDRPSLKKKKVLDFGSGKIPVHAGRLRKAGWKNISAYDLPSVMQKAKKEFGKFLHDPKALQKKYDIVVASNVFNTQESPEQLEDTLDTIQSILKPGGLLVANYPTEPRYLGWLTNKELVSNYLKGFDVTRYNYKTFAEMEHGGGNPSFLFIAKKERSKPVYRAKNPSKKKKGAWKRLEETVGAPDPVYDTYRAADIGSTWVDRLFNPEGGRLEQLTLFDGSREQNPLTYPDLAPHRITREGYVQQQHRPFEPSLGDPIGRKKTVIEFSAKYGQPEFSPEEKLDFLRYLYENYEKFWDQVFWYSEFRGQDPKWDEIEEVLESNDLQEKQKAQKYVEARWRALGENWDSARRYLEAERFEFVEKPSRKIFEREHSLAVENKLKEPGAEFSVPRNVQTEYPAFMKAVGLQPPSLDDPPLSMEQMKEWALLQAEQQWGHRDRERVRATIVSWSTPPYWSGDAISRHQETLDRLLPLLIKLTSLKMAGEKVSFSSQIPVSSTLAPSPKRTSSPRRTPSAYVAPTAKGLTKAGKTIQKLRDMAFQDIEKAKERAGEIQASYSHQRPTARRSKMQASRLLEQERKEEVAQKMLALADAMEEGKVQHLWKVNTRKDVETLMDKTMSAHYSHLHAENIPYSAHSNYPISPEDAEYAKISALKINGDRAAEIAGWLEEARPRPRGEVFTRIIKFARKRQECNDYNNQIMEAGRPYTAPFRDCKEEFPLKNWDEIDQIKKFLSKIGMKKTTIFIGLEEEKRLRRMGITNTRELQETLREFILLPTKPVESYSDPVELKVKKLAFEKIPGYFPTPKDIVKKMIFLANQYATKNFRPGKEIRVLEPSAGAGHIADEIRNYHPEWKMDVVEWNHSLREILREKGYNLIADDTFKIVGEQYDLILMNPPFEKGKDIDHVIHAYENQLAPGGFLVSIMSIGPFQRSQRKDLAWQEWFEEHDGVVKELPPGSFKQSDRTTQTNTVMVTLAKPA